MKVLVTGGSGYLGTHLRSYFNADDLSRRSGRDILSTEDAAMVKDYDLVIHLAAHLDKSPDEAERCFSTNVAGTRNLLREMRPGSAFIFASTKDVYGRFADNYAVVPESCPTTYAGQSSLEWSKLIAERYVEYYAHDQRLRSCIFRMSTIYAPLTAGNTPNFVGHFAEALNTGERLQLPGGGVPVRDVLHVDDLSKACEAFADSVIQHGLYNIGGGRQNAMSLRELLARMEDVSGLQAVVDDDIPVADPVPMNYVSDLSLIDQELGWRPSVSIDEGVSTLFRPAFSQ
jgi:nucleoside-diphosphate-sugar epimerase